MSRIAFFMPYFAGGGAERIALTLAAAFLQRGHQVDFVVVTAAGEYISDVPVGCNIVNLNAHRMLLSLPGLMKYVFKIHPDAMISLPDMANLIAIWAKMLTRSRVLLLVSNQVHLSMITRTTPKLQEKLYPLLFRLFHRVADSILCVSLGVAEDLHQRTGIPVDRIHVIYNSFPVNKILQASEEAVDHRWFSKGEPPVILSAGRLTLQKDYPTLLRAFALLRRRRDARLVILGQGEQLKMLTALAESLGIADDTAFLGFVANPYAFMARSAVFVLSSIFEGFGNVLVEALACGTQVVSTDCPSGPSEILEKGRYGKLTPPGNPGMLAAAIEAVMDNPLPRNLLQRRAEAFSVDDAVDAYLQLMGIASNAN